MVSKKQQGYKHTEKKMPPIPTFPTATTLAGQRRQVYEGRALKTRGGLRKGDLKVSKSTGKIVSKKASVAAKKAYRSKGLRQFQYHK